MRRFLKRFLVLLSAVLLKPIPSVMALYHAETQHEKLTFYNFNFRFLIYCRECDKEFCNELTEPEYAFFRNEERYEDEESSEAN